MTRGDSLGRAKTRPLLVEDAIRGALRDAIAWRLGGGNAPSVDALVAGAVALARVALDARDDDATERARTLSQVTAAARRFARSALCRRLMTVPATQFLPLPFKPSAPDAIVRDRRRRLHAVVLSAGCDPFRAGEIADRVARMIVLPIGFRLTPLNVHVFSLATALRYSFERDAVDGAARQIGSARVA